MITDAEFKSEVINEMFNKIMLGFLILVAVTLFIWSLPTFPNGLFLLFIPAFAFVLAPGPYYFGFTGSGPPNRNPVQREALQSKYKSLSVKEQESTFLCRYTHPHPIYFDSIFSGILSEYAMVTLLSDEIHIFTPKIEYASRTNARVVAVDLLSIPADSITKIEYAKSHLELVVGYVYTIEHTNKTRQKVSNPCFLNWKNSHSDFERAIMAKYPSKVKIYQSFFGFNPKPIN